jgi:hypothetical protein
MLPGRNYRKRTSVFAMPTHQISEIVTQWKSQSTAAETPVFAAVADGVARHPDDPYNLYMLARACRDSGRHNLADAATQIAFSLPHVNCRQVFHRGQAKLMLGDWSGWADCEARYVDPAEYSTHSAYWRSIAWCRKAWDGDEPLRDRVLFVIGDGAAGDSLLLLRYIPQLADLARAVVLGVHPSLLTLVRDRFANNRVKIVMRDVDHPFSFDRYVWIRSLPALMGKIPAFVPFRLIGREPASALRGRVQVGVSWAFGPYDRVDDGYQLPTPGDLAPLFSGIDADWHAVHIGSTRPLPAAAAGELKSNKFCNSYSETAQALSRMDYVVTTDTSLAHLAGVMGLPTLLVLPCRADPLWGGVEGVTTPWYPSVRLVRQRDPRGWSEAVMAVAELLQGQVDTR